MADQEKWRNYLLLCDHQTKYQSGLVVVVHGKVPNAGLQEKKTINENLSRVRKKYVDFFANFCFADFPSKTASF